MIDTGAGVIDSDYRGTVFVLLFNYSDSDFEGGLPYYFYARLYSFWREVSEGDRVAQLIIEKIETPDVVEVNVSIFIPYLTPLGSERTFDTDPLLRVCSQDLEETLRGAGGFGSTGGHTGL